MRIQSACRLGRSEGGIGMGKSLSERIAARVKAKKPTRGGLNRAAFLAVREEVMAALGDGWPVKVIWETLHAEGKIAFGYEAFLGYVQRLVLARSGRQVSAGTPAQADTPVPKVKPAERKGAAAAGGVSGFNFEAKPKIEDIL